MDTHSLTSYFTYAKEIPEEFGDLCPLNDELKENPSGILSEIFNRQNLVLVQHRSILRSSRNFTLEERDRIRKSGYADILGIDSFKDPETYEIPGGLILSTDIDPNPHLDCDRFTVNSYSLSHTIGLSVIQLLAKIPVSSQEYNRHLSRARELYPCFIDLSRINCLLEDSPESSFDFILKLQGRWGYSKFSP